METQIISENMEWETTTMRLFLDAASGILTIKAHENFKRAETLEEAEHNIKVGMAKAADCTKAILIEMPNHYVSAEVTRYYKNNTPNLPMALVANSFFKKMMGNFILSFDSPERPTRLFTNFESGKQWLLEILKLEQKG